MLYNAHTMFTILFSVITKQGQCPALRDDSAGVCVEECQSDGDCDGDMKCCSNGCGRVCAAPAGEFDCVLI